MHGRINPLEALYSPTLDVLFAFVQGNKGQVYPEHPKDISKVADVWENEGGIQTRSGVRERRLKAQADIPRTVTLPVRGQENSRGR